METHLAPNPDLPPWAVLAGVLLVAVSLVLLVVELRRRRGGTLAVAATGLVAAAALLAAVLRPVRIAARESVVGPRVVVLVDGSRSMALPSDGSKSRFDEAREFVRRFSARAKDARIAAFTFGAGAPQPLVEGPNASAAVGPTSDLGEALRALGQSPDERPAAVVVVSDGRLDEPPETTAPATREAFGD